MGTRAEDNPFPSLLFVETADPATPDADSGRMFLDTDGILKWIDDAGTVTPVALGTISGGSVATDAIWDTAGDLAVGSGANTAAKLVIGAVGSVLGRINGAVAWNAGTSFPGSPATGDRFYRSDRSIEYFYDGTRWLSTTLYRETVGFATVSATVVAGRIPAWVSTDIWLDALWVAYNVGATNTGSAYWDLTLRKVNSAVSFTSVVTITTSADSTSTAYNKTASIGALMGSFKWLDLTAFLTGGATAMNIGGSVTYRLVG